jgi:hypothetical protein
MMYAAIAAPVMAWMSADSKRQTSFSGSRTLTERQAVWPLRFMTSFLLKPGPRPPRVELRSRSAAARRETVPRAEAKPEMLRLHVL